MRRTESGLSQASANNLSALVSLDRTLIGASVGRVRESTQSRVDEGLRLVLGI
ncbi:MAG: hypothetical protein JO036_15775 [Candidatus Eremiobacteraeota bacterium]|nr:hypothetical protein [Candidatus Eremiobacteraeota bacterium]